MPTFDLTGQWRGEYRFGELYPANLLAVPFLMELRGGWFRRFRGTVRDDPARGMPELGLVRGRFVGVTITFTKFMPVGYTYTESGARKTLRSIVQSHTGHDPGEIKNPPVHYTGTFDPDSVVFRGDWRLAAPFSGSGTWWMARERL